ncbi:RNA polymerase sigma-70 factor [Rhodococcus tukisamuensis]|uniref:RNA polymerase sigma-70 factor, ECF subfamily n=1 Tax=Rhodococcus tukisamuensis TaxID=168276 RepID=A0A1G6W7X7_9NOCA|nr:RNA polymerase sigma-70 factor [Rhodococcus tukisamuensis]SDD61793.1 RNA polymerase sigma-70 factor, ECF subfamily [Rhodococcus tukisamuensis]
MSPADEFTEYRPLLFTIAYEILGSAADAEDALQDSYLRWSEVDRAGIDSPRAYLAQVVTRQALNQLRSAGRRREDYVGSWLPEPIRTEPDAAEDVLLAESVSMAMLLVLETLSPDERAVFVLREVFGFSHREVAEAVGKSEAAVRQTSHRARSHVHSRRRRFEPSSTAAQEVAGQFLSAAVTGDIQALMDLMAPDVVEISDGGGKVSAARRPVVGRERVARFMAGLARTGPADLRFEVGLFNSLPSVLIYSGEHLDTVAMFEVTDALISGIYLVRNPDKLAGVAQSRALTR